MPPLLLELWREQHPLGHEQTALDFKANFPAAKRAPLFREIAPQETTLDVGGRHVKANNLRRNKGFVRARRYVTTIRNCVWTYRLRDLKNG